MKEAKKIVGQITMVIIRKLTKMESNFYFSCLFNIQNILVMPRFTYRLVCILVLLLIGHGTENTKNR